MKPNKIFLTYRQDMFHMQNQNNRLFYVGENIK